MKKYILFLFTLVFALLLVACGGNSTEESTESQTDQTEEANSEAASGEVTIKHELDEEEIVVPKNPENVVVFDFNTLDTLDYLGLGERVSGFPKATVPEYLSEYDSDAYENLGSLKEPDFEAIHALNPDLIIISSRQAELYDQFKEIAPTIYLTLDPNNYLQSFADNAKIIGEIFDKQSEVEAAVAELNNKVNSIKEKAEASDETALIVLGTEGKISAFGPASRYGFIHDVLGFKPADENIEVSQHGQNITFEYVLETNPDMIFIIDRDAAIGMESTVKDSFENDLVKKTNAYKNDQLVYLDGEIWYLAGGGIKSFDLMLDEIASALE